VSLKALTAPMTKSFTEVSGSRVLRHSNGKAKIFDGLTIDFTDTAALSPMQLEVL
jgi:hypothetical protein